MNATTELVTRLKEAGQDEEWYPTSGSMLEIIAKDILEEFGDKSFSILDIGAGNGNALQTICTLTENQGQKYAIEKSQILLGTLPEDIFIIGTDFYEQTLIDKQVDVVFCNPPYSDFDTWMQKIVTEANANLMYFVVPQRWKDNKFLEKMISKRCDLKDTEDPLWESDIKELYRKEQGICKVLGSMSFEDSEFRKARAQIDIVKIKVKSKDYHRFIPKVDPFDIWFDSTFSINADQTKSIPSSGHQSAKLHELVEGQNLIERLEELYHEEFRKFLDTYKALEKLDYSLFKELGVDLTQVKGGLRSKIAGLKNLFWKELFDNFTTITSRLTSKSREKLLKKLTAHTSVDFTSSNAYAVVIWAIRNANQYLDEQLKEVYFEISDRENIKNYKSNTKLIEDGWRYQKREQSHYTLDYRLVVEKGCVFSPETWRNYEYPNNLSQSSHELLQDICTVGKNLGFEVVTNSMDFQWVAGERNEFLLQDGNLFMDVRAYKKGTLHIRCNPEFMKKFNIEAGRLNGWVKSPGEAVTEMEIQGVEEVWGTNFKLKPVLLLSQ